MPWNRFDQTGPWDVQRSQVSSCISYYVSKYYNRVDRVVAIKRHTAEEEESLRRYILCEEDRATLTAEKWTGGYRWYRSATIVCLEHYRPIELRSELQRLVS